MTIYNYVNIVDGNNKPLQNMQKLRKLQQDFLKDLASEQQRCMREYTPFCGACAILDFNSKLDIMQKEVELVASGQMNKQVTLNIEADWNKYNKMNLINYDPILEKKLIAGTISVDGGMVMTAYYANYKCSLGHGLSMQIPIEVYKQRIVKTK